MLISMRLQQQRPQAQRRVGLLRHRAARISHLPRATPRQQRIKDTPSDEGELEAATWDDDRYGAGGAGDRDGGGDARRRLAAAAAWKQRTHAPARPFPLQKKNNQAEDDAPPEELSAARHVIVEPDFLPHADAEALRGVYDARFADPRATHVERFMWDYW